MNERFLEAISKLKKAQDELEVKLKSMEQNIDEKGSLNMQKALFTVADDLARYTIKDGNWYYNGKDTGIQAEAHDGEDGKQGPQGIPGKDGKDGRPGRDGKNGKDGKDGRPGRDGKDGKDGKNGLPGRDGKDGVSPELKIGKIEVSPEYGGAMAKLRPGKDNIMYLDLTLPRGPQGFTGFDGKDAKINGENTIEIKAGKNITINQDNKTLTINSTGGGGGTSDYTDLENKPSINNVTLSGNKSLSDLGIQPSGSYLVNTDYATSSVAGVLKPSAGLLVNASSGNAYCEERTYQQYQGSGGTTFISKGTLENVITGKGLIDSSSDITGNASTSTTLKTFNYNRNGTNYTWAKVATTSLVKTWEEKHAYLFVKGTHSTNFKQNGIISIDAVGNAIKSKVNAYSAQFISASTDLNVENFYIEYQDGDANTDATINFWVKNTTSAYATWQFKILQNTGWTIESAYTSVTTLPTQDFTGKISELNNKTLNDKDGNDITTTYVKNTEIDRIKATLPTTTGSGEEVTLEKTIELDFVKPPLPRGNSEQEGEPSPDNEVPITNVTGNVKVTISNNDNSESKTLPVSLGNIELCKIGNYQDYFYKASNKWYLHKEIKKILLNGTESWSISNNVFYLTSISDYINSSGKICLSDKYTATNNTTAGTSAITQNNSICFFITNTNPRLYIRDERFNNVNAFKAELSENNVKVYYSTTTPTDTEITDATLITQLEEISKTLSYQGQTNITSNTIALFDVEAYQDLKIILNEKLDLKQLSTFDSTKTQVLKNINGTLTWVNE